MSILGKLALFVFLLVAAVLTALPLVSVSRIPNTDIVRVFLDAGYASGVNEVQFGTRSFCLRRVQTDLDLCDVFSPCNFGNSTAKRVCSTDHFGYGLSIGKGLPKGPVSVGPGWTNTLATYAGFAAGVALCCVLYLFAFFPWTSTAAFRALRMTVYILTLSAGVVTATCDGIFYTRMQALTGTLIKLNYGQKVVTGPGFVIQILAWFLLFIIFIWDWVVSAEDIKKRREHKKTSMRLPTWPTHDAEAERATLVADPPSPTLINSPAMTPSPRNSDSDTSRKELSVEKQVDEPLRHESTSL